MNRSERRRQARQNVAVLTARTEHELNQAMDAVKKEVLFKAVNDLTAAFIMALNYKFGFGKDRIARLLQSVNNQMQHIMDGEITVEDIAKWCKEHGFDYEQVFQQR